MNAQTATSRPSYCESSIRCPAVPVARTSAIPASRTIASTGSDRSASDAAAVVAERDEHRPRMLEHERGAQPPVAHAVPASTELVTATV